MDFLIPKYRRDGNAKVSTAYVGVAPGGGTVTRVTSVNKNTDSFESTRAYGAGIPRGQGGRVGTFILGGMETTLDEIEDMVEGIKEKKFVPQRGSAEIAQMCRHLIEKRNETIKYLRKNPSEAPKKRPAGPTLYLPVGYRMAQTAVPGIRVAVQG